MSKSTSILSWSVGGGAVGATVPAAIVLQTMMARGESEGAGIVIALAIAICIPVGVVFGAITGLLMAVLDRRLVWVAVVVLTVATAAYDLMILAK